MRRETYLGIYAAVARRPWLSVLLGVASGAITVIIAVAYAAFLVGITLIDTLDGVKYLAVTAIPFILVSVLRQLLNAPRPYEVLDTPYLASLRNSGKRGHGFPSRHTFSAILIGTTVTFMVPPVGIILLVFGITLGACRVFEGRHFLRDVLAGGAIGALSGVVGMLIVNI